MKTFLWALPLTLISAPIGFSQSVTPVAANQVNVTDGLGGYSLQPYGGGGGLPTGFSADAGTGIFTAPNGYAISSGQQIVNNYTQGTAPTTPPANTVQFGAPATVASSYNMYLPSNAPTLPNSSPAWPAGGGTATFLQAAEVVIQKQILGGAVSTITFSSIPQTFTHLRLVGFGAYSGSSATSVNMTFNGDTGNDYASQNLGATGSTATAGANSAQPALFAGFVSGTNVPNVPATFDITFPGYSTTVFRKEFTGSNISGTGTGTFQTFFLGGQWASTAAITSMTLSPATGNFVAGTTFVLYGVN